MKTWVVGDIHGAHKALLQVLDRAKFDYKKDELIVLGDVVDGWTETKQCINELLKIKHLIMIIGNHDLWAWDWMKHGTLEPLWTSQGGKNTIKSYGGDFCSVPESHIKFLKDANQYYIDEENRLFVHGGIDPNYPIEQQHIDVLTWDRDLFSNARKKEFFSIGIPDAKKQMTPFKEIFIGHTTTQIFEDSCRPLHYCEIWNLDTGGGWSGKLTMMNVDTKEYVQSDWVYELYPNEKGRKG